MHRSLPVTPRLRPVIPSVVTIAGMFCGYLSLILTFKHSWLAAAWLIAAGGMLDAFDGPVARRLRAESKFGAELDSFTDLVTFGLAPALLFYWAFFSAWGVVGLAFGFLPVVASMLRLTRYNLTATTGNREYFRGFTSTANGCLLASFVLFSHDLWHHPFISVIAAVLVTLSAVLMVSGVPYMSIGKFMGGGVWKTPQGSFWFPVAMLVLLFPAKALFPAMLTVMFQGPLGPRIEHVFHHLQSIRR